MGLDWKIPYPLTRIDREEQLKGEEITLEKLRLKYGTFQCRCVGLDRVGKKKYNSRVGIQTDLGDIEIHLWKELVLRLAEKAGEKALYQHLLAWTIKHNIVEQSKEDIEEDAMHAYVRRDFDNPLWEYFMPFNRKYRPEFLNTVDIATFVNDCCNRPYQIPSIRLEKNRTGNCLCEYCRKVTPFRVIGGNQ